LRRAASILLALATLGAGGCTPGPYSCRDSSSCVVQGVQGQCVSTGLAAYCAFPDGKCEGSNLRWDESSAAEVADQCVPPAYSDGGVE
jgi:hypothetical protein